MATDAEILVTREALLAALAGIPAIDPKFLVETGTLTADHLLLPDQGWNPGSRIRLGRVGTGISLMIYDIGRATAGTGNVPIFRLPQGFRPMTDQYHRTWGGVRFRAIASNGLIEVTAPPTSADYLTLNFDTAQAAPTLPI